MKLSYILVVLIFALSCTRDDLHKPVSKNGAAPGAVSNVKVVNLNGKATLSYTLPSDEDLSYVRAEYETSSGH